MIVCKPDPDYVEGKQIEVWVKHRYIEMFKSNGWIDDAVLVANDADKPYFRGTYMLTLTYPGAIHDMVCYFSGLYSYVPQEITTKSFPRRRVHIRTTL